MFREKICLVLCFLALMTVVLPIRGEEFKCSSNLDCPKGTYCYKESALYKCAPCSDCIRFFRKNSTVLDCPQRPEQCGECIAGYHLPKLIDGSEPSTCISISAEILQPLKYINPVSLPPDIPEGKGFGNLYLWIAILGVTSIVSLTVAAFYSRRKCNTCNTKRSNEIISESDGFCISPSAPPPPYQTASELTSHSIEHETKPLQSTLPFTSDIEINTTGAVRHQIDCEFDRRQQANCYKFPFYVNEGSLAPDQWEHTSRASSQEDNLLETFDDTTQPSTWRPNAEGDETERPEENENPAGNSGCEERHFAMISSERSNFSLSPEMSSLSNVSTNLSVQNVRIEPTHKKPRMDKYSEINGFNLNICINNANANVNENNNTV